MILFIFMNRMIMRRKKKKLMMKKMMMKKVVQRERLKRREKSRVKIQAMTMNEIGKKYVYSNVYLNKY